MPKEFYNLKIAGYTSPSKKRYVGFDHKRKRWFAPRDALLTDTVGTLNDLAAQGLPIGGRGYVAQVMEEVQEIGPFAPAEIIEEPGWNGPTFARPDSKIFIPEAAEAGGATPGIGYFRHPVYHARQGKLKAWLQSVPAPLAESDVAMFTIGLPLAAVIRNLLPQPIEPFGVELVSDQHVRPVRQLLLSVVGSMKVGSLVTAPVNEVIASAARFVDASRDDLLVLGDIAGYLYGASDKKRAAASRSLLFDYLLASGEGDANAGGKPAPIFVAVGARPLADLLGLDDEANDRLQQGMMTIPIPPNAFHGSGDGGDSSGVHKSLWTQKMLGDLLQNYGVALYAFQRRLVERRAKGFPALQKKLQGWVDTFLRKARKITRKQPSDAAIAARFALVYAALRLADELQVLPPGPHRGKAMFRVFKRFLADRPQPPTAAAILQAVAGLPGVLKVDAIGEDIGKNELSTVPAFIKDVGKGRRELWVITAQKKITFDWPVFRKLPGFADHYLGKGEKDRAGGKRKIGSWTDARVIRFRLSG